MKRTFLRRIDERGLKVVLAVFFLALAVPAGVLIAQAYSQLKWQAFRSTQVAAEELAARIDAALRVGVAAEDARSFGTYSFLVVEGDAAANFVQRSPLSAFPVESAVPGVLGYFQVDAAGRLTTPLLPEAGVTAASYGIAPAEEAARTQRVEELRELLARNQLVRAPRDEAPAAPAPAPERESALPERERRQLSLDTGQAAGATTPSAQAGFDRLAAAEAATQTDALASRADAGGGARETAVRSPAAAEPPAAANADAIRPALLEQRGNIFADERQKRVEETFVAEPAVVQDAAAEADDAPAAKVEVAVRTFAGELDPLELGVLDTGHLVLFRNVWREGQRYVQGALIDRDVFATAIEMPYRASSVGLASHLNVGFQARILSELKTANSYVGPGLSRDLAGDVLHRVGCRRPSATSNSCS